MMKIGFDDDGNTTLLKFDLERPEETETGYTTHKVEVQAPFLGLVPIPSLLVEDTTIEFQMEVSATETEKETTGSEVQWRYLRYASRHHQRSRYQRSSLSSG